MSGQFLPGRGRRPISSPLAVFVLLTVCVFPLLLSLGMAKKLSHDEHQHVAAGALLARQGLWPYRDFPHFHPPNLVFVYALVYQHTTQLLLGARFVSVVSATGVAGLVGALAFATFLRQRRGTCVALSTAVIAAALCLTASVFTDTSGRAWNQEPALLLALLAFVAHLRSLQRSSRRWLFASGLLLGLAIGTRITYAPLLAPFGLMMLWPKASAASFQPTGEHLPPENLRHCPAWGRSWPSLASFSGGLAAGLAGFVCLFATAPEATLFGNFGFAAANIDYRYATGEPRTMTLLKKLRYLVKEVIRPDCALFLAGVFSVLFAVAQSRRRGRPLPAELRFVLLILPFILIGSLAPSPLFRQYFYPFVPFSILGAVYAWSALSPASRWYRPVLAASGICCGLSAIIGAGAYDDLDNLTSVDRWTPIAIHRESEEIRSEVPPRRVLTLAPIPVLEAGLEIYPAFSSGPFAWRVSPFVQQAKAARLGMITPTALPEYLASEPPAALLLGVEKRGEGPLLDYAVEQEFRVIPLTREKQLWIREL